MKSTITKFFNSYRGVVVFSGLKYLEIILTALTTFFLAEVIGPDEMGKAIPILLYITYSTYLSLGVNQVIIKNYDEFLENKMSFEFLSINLQYHIFISIVTVVLALIFIDFEFALFTGLISAATITRSYFMAYFRVINKISKLNKNNLIFTILLLCTVFNLVETWFDYLFYWAISLWIALIIYIFDARNMLKVIITTYILKFDLKQVKYVLNQGIRLAILGATTTFLLTFDRIIISYLDLSLEIKGTYQLADYFGKAVYMIGTTILFYYYPTLLELLRKDHNFRLKYFWYVKLAFLAIVPITLLFFIFVNILQIFFFKDYANLNWYVSYNLILKLIVLLSSLISAIYIALDQEYRFLLTYTPILVGVIILLITITLLDFNSITAVGVIALAFLTITLAYQLKHTSVILKRQIRE
jgi:O-antigen/teichoic acid export membrane protein